MTVTDYVKATLKVLQNNADSKSVLEALETHLSAQGHSQMYPAILSELLVLMVNKETSNVLRLTVARESDYALYKKEIEPLIPDDSTPVVIVSPHIIGGYILRSKDTYIDNSHKAKLLQVYQKVSN